MSETAVTSTRCTRWPLISIPSIESAISSASAGVLATFTPPALPRPPTFTCALTTTGPLASSANALASVAVVATPAAVTGTEWAANDSIAWYSKRSIRCSSLVASTHVSRSRPRRPRGFAPVIRLTEDITLPAAPAGDVAPALDGAAILDEHNAYCIRYAIHEVASAYRSCIPVEVVSSGLPAVHQPWILTVHTAYTMLRRRA